MLGTVFFIISLWCAQLHFARAQSSAALFDSSYDFWGFGLAAGVGGMNSATGTGTFIFATHKHLQVGIRIAGSSPDDGDNQGSTFPLVTHGPLRFSPAEFVSDRSLLIGYRMHGDRTWLALSAGPSYTFGVLRGSTLISSDTTPQGWFNAQQVLQNYNSIDVRRFGATGQVDMGLKFGQYAGFGLSIFYTANKQKSYSGVLLSIVFGVLKRVMVTFRSGTERTEFFSESSVKILQPLTSSRYEPYIFRIG